MSLIQMCPHFSGFGMKGFHCIHLCAVHGYYSNFLEGMSEGLTLNPDILCNQKIKFGTLFRYITQTMGVSRIATGHYARIRQMQDGGW